MSLSLPAGCVCPDPTDGPSTENEMNKGGTRAAKKEKKKEGDSCGVKSSLLRSGMGLGDVLYAEDKRMDTFPLPSKAFYPYVDDATLKK